MRTSVKHRVAKRVKHVLRTFDRKSRSTQANSLLTFLSCKWFTRLHKMHSDNCAPFLFAVLSALILFGSFVPVLSVEMELDEGSRCQMENGVEGICKKLLECPYRIQEMREGSRSAKSSGRCGFVGLTEIVCCPFNISDTMNARFSKFEGTDCLLEDNTLGICKKLAECPCRIEGVQRGMSFYGTNLHCGFDNFSYIVCCPRRPFQAECCIRNHGSLNTTTTDNIVTDHSRYQERVNTSPVNTTVRIIQQIAGGIMAAFRQFPSAVALGYRNYDFDNETRPFKYGCGGTLISTRHVLTAAHCVRNIHNYLPVLVRMGTNDLRETPREMQESNISRIIVHPSYKLWDPYNDLAILELSTPAEITASLKPACLFPKPLEEEESFVVAAGWGATDDDNEGSFVLMHTLSMRLVRKDVCKEQYNFTTKLTRGVDDTLVCAHGSNNSTYSDACAGDSGGPLFVYDNNQSFLSAVTATGGVGCGTAIPGIYTAVYPFLDWIESVVWPNE